MVRINAGRLVVGNSLGRIRPLHVRGNSDSRGSVRRIEPYSLRRTRDGNIVLHATRAADGKHRSYRIDRIQGVRATRQSFIPRFAVELTPQGPPVIPPAASRAESSGLPRRRSGAAPRRTRTLAWPGGLRYIYECTYCGKRFTRKKTTSRLNPHKDKSGYPCPPVASQTRTPPGTGIIADPEPREPGPAPGRPHPGRQ